MVTPQPVSKLPGGAQDADGVEVGADSPLGADAEYPDPDSDSEELDVEEG